MDLGGESTQIAYQFVPRNAGEEVDFAHDIFSKSFLSCGAKEAQFRFENYLMSNREVLRSSFDNRTNKLFVPNPCNNEGLVGTMSTYDDLFHEGTGNVGDDGDDHDQLDKCESILTALLQGDTPCVDTPTSSESYSVMLEIECSLWSLSIPTIHGDFVAMSLFFYVVDFVKAIYLLEDHVQPSVEELKAYGRSFCSLKWSEVKELYGGKHRFTSDEVLKQRCFQVVEEAEINARSRTL